MQIEETATDYLGQLRCFFCEQNSQQQKRLEDQTLNVRTHDFEFRSYRDRHNPLPGKYIVNPPHWKPQCVSAHANVTKVATFIRDVLQHYPADESEVIYISSLNCVEDPSQKEWRNAAWYEDYQQVIFGQYFVNGEPCSYAVAQDIVAHEFFHGLTYQTAKLDYWGESGALNESYSDIFGILVSNFNEPDIGEWNWEIGRCLGEGGGAIRDLSNPLRYGQPDRMNNYVYTQRDCGGVHYNSGIHNKAAFNLLTSQDNEGNFLFDVRSAAALFYLALKQLSNTSVFSDSRRAVEQVAKTLFRNEAAKGEKLGAISSAFDSVGIE